MSAPEQHPVPWSERMISPPLSEHQSLLLDVAEMSRRLEAAHPRHRPESRTREDDSAHLEALGELEAALRAARRGEIEEAREALAKAGKVLL